MKRFIQILCSALLALSFAFVAHAAKSVESTATGKGQASSNQAALVDAKKFAHSKCLDKNKKAICGSHKKGSKARKKCLADLKKNKKVKYAKVKRSCHKIKVGGVRVMKGCKYTTRCWHEDK